jgi:hypothetical protein
MQVARMRDAGGETGLVYCWWVWIDEDGRVLDRSPRWRIEGYAHAALFQVNVTGNASVPLYRRSAIEETGGYAESFASMQAGGCEDWDLALRVSERRGVAVVPELLVGYRRVAGSMSTQPETMWRSYALVAANFRGSARQLDTAILATSAAQFALYIASGLFWSGRRWQAFGWALRAWRSVLLIRVVAHAGRVLWRRLCQLPSRHAPVMRPGVSLDTVAVPDPLVPYDRIHARLASVSERSGARGGKWLRSRCLQWAAVALSAGLCAAQFAAGPLEAGPRWEWAHALPLLRQAVQRPEIVCSLPGPAPGAYRIDTYRFSGPVPPAAAIDLHLTSYADRAYPGVRRAER